MGSAALRLLVQIAEQHPEVLEKIAVDLVNLIAVQLEKKAAAAKAAAPVAASAGV
jgi:hypothetical protein